MLGTLCMLADLIPPTTLELFIAQLTDVEIMTQTDEVTCPQLQDW